MEKSAMTAAGLENLDMKAVARVAQKAVLDEIYLYEAKINRDQLNEPVEAVSLEHKYSTKIVPLEKDNNVLRILCNFSVAAFDKKSPDKIVMNIEASFSTSYMFESIADFNHDDIEHFSKINPIFNAWAYWREFVQSMTTRMGFPALTIPLLKVMPKKSAAKKIKSPPTKKESTRPKKPSA